MSGPASETIEAAIMAMLGERGAGKTIAPSEVARALAGSDETVWSRLMAPIRQAAVRLAANNRVVLRRKGRIVDPHDFKGVYRIGRAGEADQGAGNSASVLPVKR